MFIIALVAFREFLEAFLITGVFLGISKKLTLKKEKEILLAAGLGILFSLVLSTTTYLFGDHARAVLTERNADLLEGYLMTFSGFFIVYLVLSLHGRLKKKDSDEMSAVVEKTRPNVFDFSLFLTVLFMVSREGVEIALFTASTALFSVFMQNFVGLLIGFGFASTIGLLLYFAYSQFPLRKIFKITEFIIVITGAALVQRGLGELFEVYWNIHLSRIVPIPLHFLPEDETVIGHLLKGLFGIDREFSVMKLAIMVYYIAFIYFGFKLVAWVRRLPL
jgi:high-affinity iron transporter